MLHYQVPIFTTVNDNGWATCETGVRILALMQEIVPRPSRRKVRQEGNVAAALMHQMRELKECKTAIKRPKFIMNIFI